MSTSARRTIVTIHLPAPLPLVSSVMMVVAESYPDAVCGEAGNDTLVVIEIPEDAT